jgi:hypothetical protein
MIFEMISIILESNSVTEISFDFVRQAIVTSFEILYSESVPTA